ncbi:hypothetical protein HWV62_16646 [Athelia sp. TMB]|nr:hypothetical protein HWV62_16646 [Athelia sp. TMB]
MLIFIELDQVPLLQPLLLLPPICLYCLLLAVHVRSLCCTIFLSFIVCIRAVLASQISLFERPGQQAVSASDANTGPDSPETSARQIVERARQRSYKRVAEQDDNNPQATKYKSLPGSSKKVKITAPRSFPGPNQPKASGSKSASTAASDDTEQLSNVLDDQMRNTGRHDIPRNDFQHFVTTAKTHGLWFTVLIKRTSNTLLPQLNESINDHLADHNLTLPHKLGSRRPEDIEDFGTIRWQLVKMKRGKSGGHAYNMNIETTLLAAHITLDNLKGLTCCRSPGSSKLWIIINSRFGDVIGPIWRLGPHSDPAPELQYDGHSCFGERFTVCAADPGSDEQEELRQVVTCFESCPKESDEVDWRQLSEADNEPLEAEMARFEASRLRPSRTANDANMVVDNIPMPQAQTPATRLRSPSFEIVHAQAHVINRHRSPSFEIVEPDPMEGPTTPMPDANINAWIGPIFRPAEMNAAIHFETMIWAPTILDAAKAVLSILQYSHSTKSTPPVLPQGVRHISNRELEPICLLEFRNYFTVNGAVGNAPKRAIWEALPEVMAEDFQYFKMHHNSYTVVAYPASTTSNSRRQRFQAYGSFFALFTLYTNRGPPQSSFALLLAMLLEPHQLIRLPLDYIRFLDPEAANRLEPWVILAKDATFPKAHNSTNTPQQTALINLLCELDIQPAFIEDDRDARAHDAYTTKIFCRVLLDLEPEQIWGHPDFEALKRGYDIHIQYANPSSKTFLQCFPMASVLSLVAGLYNPRIVDVNLIIPRLRFDISGKERRRTRSQTRDDFAQLFVRAIHRYLKGCGHAIHHEVSAFQTLTEEDITREANNPHTRPHLLLAAFTESKLWPRDDQGWTLRFIMEDPQEPDSDMDAAMESRLLEIPTVGVPSRFDTWFHIQLLAVAYQGYFNRL